MWFDLKGDERLKRCATEGCGGQPIYRLEAEGVGSNYCSGCRAKIEAADSMRAKIEHELDEMMMGAENFFGAQNPKRRGHIRCALDRIMAHVER
jgi:hypothetical protein